MRERISGTSALFQLYADDDFSVYQLPASLVPSHPLHEQVVLSLGSILRPWMDWSSTFRCTLP